MSGPEQMDERLREVYQKDLEVDWDIHHDPSGETVSHMIIKNAREVLRCMGEEVNACNTEKGWHDESRTFGDDIALLHSEVSEMLEAFRDHGTDDATIPIPFEAGAPPKPQGVGSEAADVLVRLLDTCHRYQIDLFVEWRRKMDFNWTRPHRHGGKRL